MGRELLLWGGLCLHTFFSCMGCGLHAALLLHKAESTHLPCGSPRLAQEGVVPNVLRACVQDQRGLSELVDKAYVLCSESAGELPAN